MTDAENQEPQEPIRSDERGEELVLRPSDVARAILGPDSERSAGLIEIHSRRDAERLFNVGCGFYRCFLVVWRQPPKEGLHSAARQPQPFPDPQLAAKCSHSLRHEASRTD